MTSERPFADGRRTAVFVFNELRVDAGRLTQTWLARLRAFDDAGWATHAALINKDANLPRTVASLVADGRFPAGTVVHHYALRDRRIRPSWWGPLPAGQTLDDRIGDWLDWLTGQIPGAVVVADSPAAYPYLAQMTNPLVARVAGIHLNHLRDPRAEGAAGAVGAPGARAPGSGADRRALDPSGAGMTQRFAERFAPIQHKFDALVVMTAGQAGDLQDRFGSDTPVVVIPPGVPRRPDLPATSVAGVRRLVSVGPLDANARHSDAIRAVAAAARTHPEVQLQIVGIGDLADELTALAVELGAADRVAILAPGPDEDAPFDGAALTLWTGRRDACPQSIIRSLAHGVPVVARDTQYGPAELLTTAELGDVVADAESLAAAVVHRLGRHHDPQEVRTAAGALLRRTDPAAVAGRWISLAAQLADQVCDHRAPSLLVDSLSTNTRVLRLPGVLADSPTALAGWSCELPGLVEPAGWLTEPPLPLGVEREEEDDDELPVHPHAAGPSREVVVQLRSNALAFVAIETGSEFRVEFTDGSHTAPLLTTGFSERIIASRVGNATLRRRPDGSVRVSPRRELLFATNVDGRLLVRTRPEEPPSDVTHAIDWIVDIDWADLRATERGASFVGTLRATWIAPADDSPPSICVTDVGGYSRAVGQLHYTSEPTVDGLEWTAPVDGVIESAPLAATTELARGALALHVGYRGLLVPIGGLWTHGQRDRIHLTSNRGEVTLLPSPGGRVLAAPGKGYRARVSGAVRSAFVRG